ncbi:uncharacterized protein [Amphiura filiformis]|uniref:uncharacterized protein n=1 Tax=Amphiura filiformis TaxID=82378 RepID=UPI003B227AB3
MTGLNKAPNYPFHWVTEYPAISGKTLLNNVMFSNFEKRCRHRNVMIMTNSNSGDFMHPIYMQNIHMDQIQPESKLLLHRPNGRLVNPSDCVDMDCDGMKNALLQDLDGTFLGSVATVIPDSAFEWGGDPSRGLGNYRIPKVMVTEVDGSRIPYKKKMPNKGIYRGHDNQCTWQPSWTAYECHDIDYNVLVIESMDDDTEIRRLSPVGLYADTYIDLINGPQDHGWCNGYTCQERISTFYAIVAMDLEYELVFTGTNPQDLRFQLLNAEDDSAVVVGIWYASPQRLDVYVNGVYILPNNGAFEFNEFVWKNDKTPAEYMPSLLSTVNGENFFDRMTQYLHILVRGPRPVIIRTVPVIMVTFSVPAIPVDAFYEVNLIANLVAFLDVEPAQIRIVNIIAEDSFSGRRRRSTEGADVVIEIGDPPADSIEEPEEDVPVDEAPSVMNGTTTSNTTSASIVTETVTTVAAPTATTNVTGNTTSHDHSGHTLSFDSLINLQSTIANEMQGGSLADTLDIEIMAMAMTDPLPEPVDPTGGVRASNGTAENGTERYDEHQAHLAAESEMAESTLVVFRIPAQLIVEVEPAGAVEDEAFDIQPKITVLDAMGILVEHLGTRSKPWLLTASIRPGTGSHDASLHGNLTLPFIHGWVNFTGLEIDAPVNNVTLDFHITYPNTSTFAVGSTVFSVTPRPYLVVVMDAPAHHGDMHVGDKFNVIIEIHDGITSQAAQDLNEKIYTWYASASLYIPSNYPGQIVGETNVTFDLSTARAHIDNLTIDASGYHYIIQLHVYTTPPSNYEKVLLLDPFDVVTASHNLWNASHATFTIRFDADYDKVVGGNKEEMKIYFTNMIGRMYPNVTISNVTITRGSIWVTFDLQGEHLESIRDQLWEDLTKGQVTLNFNGYTLTADPYLGINKDTTLDIPYRPEIRVTPSYELLLPLWTMTVIVANGVIVIVILVWCCYKCDCSSSGEEYSMYYGPLSNQETPKETAQKCSTPGKEEMLVEDISDEREASPTPSVSGKTNSAAAEAECTSMVPLVETFSPILKTKPQTPCPILKTKMTKPSLTKPATAVAELTSMVPQTPSPILKTKMTKPSLKKKADGATPSPKLEHLKEKEMFIMAKNNHGVFSKIACIDVNYKGTVYDLHQTVTSALADKLKGREFDLLTETLEKVDVSYEKQLTVAQVYSSDCVLIRLASEETVAAMLCPCGKEGEFTCTSCGKQAYCSPKCQTRDWPRHTNVCSKFK